MNIEKSGDATVKSILRSLDDFNLEIAPKLISHPSPKFSYHALEQGMLIGGIVASLGYWGGLEIHALFVHKNHRRKGIASELLNRAENGATAAGATIAIVDTFTFQAPDFYKKNGYTEIGRIPDFPKTGEDRVYLVKRFSH